MESSGAARALAAWAMALGVVLVAFALQAHAGFNLVDEGYLWYGVRQVGEGAVPLRDFMAYDVGRYYWSAAVVALVGDDGMVAVRLSVALFQAVGLGAVLACLLARGASGLRLALAAIVLAMWMYPRHKGFDASLALLLIATLAWLLDAPTWRRYVLAGLCVGVVAIFGRNHGFYGGLAVGAALLLNAWLGRGEPFRRAFPALAAGVLAGYAPMLAWLALDAGMRTMFVEDLLYLFEYGGTNLALPVPWPHLAFEGRTGAEAWRALVVGLGFVALPVFAVAALVRVARGKAEFVAREPLFCACALLAVPYAHFAFSRADLAHLAQGIFPLLVGLLAWSMAATERAERIAIATGAVLASISLFALLPLQPGWQARSPAWKDLRVGTDLLRVDPATAAQLGTARALVAMHRPGPRQVFVAPLWIGLYPALGLQAPHWELFGLFPRDEAFQRGEIARLQAAGVRLALLQDVPVDGRDDLRYARTHALIQRHVEANFVRGPDRRGVPGLQVYVRPANAAPWREPTP